MRFKLLIALVMEEKTDKVMEAARKAGATGATVINHARGEGLEPAKSFLGLTVESPRDVLLFLVEEHLARDILETIDAAGEFRKTGAGIAFQIDVEDAVGLTHQVVKLTELVEDQL